MSRNSIESLDTTGSYRWFARSKVVMEEADIPALRWAIDRKIHSVADIGSGPAVIINHLIDLGILQEPYRATAVDLDRYELRVGRQDLLAYQSYANIINFVQAVAEDIPIADETQDLATFLNTVHLTKLQKSIPETYRIVKPGGRIVITTVYDPVYGYLLKENPDDEEEEIDQTVHNLWQLPAKKGLKYLVRMGYRPDRAERPDGYSEAQIKESLEDAGFSHVRSVRKRVDFDEESFKNIHIYNGYVGNVYPGIPIEIAREAITYGCEEVFKANPGITYPRGYIYLTAQKPWSSMVRH